MTDEHKQRMGHLQKLLRNHDWFYQYSDDARVFRKGEAEWEQIRLAAKACGPDGQRLKKAHIDIHYNPGTGFELGWGDNVAA